MRPAIPFGVHPWLQTFWDARAAANFICGGMGCGLVVAAAVSGATGAALAVPLLIGLTIVGCGLAAVFAELGRPLRAANVIRNPRTSWMAREALVAPLLFAAGALAATTGAPAFVAAAAVLALVFAVCQGRMVHAARGIPAWRAPQMPWLLPLTGLAEGAGLWLAIAAFTQAHSVLVAEVLGVAVVARFLAFRVYRRSLGGSLVPAAARSLDTAGRVLLLAGTLAVLALLALAAAAPPFAWARWVALAAGLAAALSGVWLKAAILLRASHTQGWALHALPVRGTRR